MEQPAALDHVRHGHVVADGRVVGPDPRRVGDGRSDVAGAEDGPTCGGLDLLFHRRAPYTCMLSKKRKRSHPPGVEVDNTRFRRYIENQVPH